MRRPTTLVLLTLCAGCAPEPERGGGCRDRPRGPADPPTWSVLHVDPPRSEVARGALLTTQNDKDRSWAVAVDGCGEVLWQSPVSAPEVRIYRAHLSLDGTRVLAAEQARVPGSGPGMLREHWIDGDEERATPLFDNHHDFRELSGDRVAWLAWERFENLWLPNLPYDVLSDQVRVSALGDDGSERLFGLYPDLGIDPYWPCSHMGHPGAVPGTAEWSHSNSLIRVDDSDRLLLFARYHDALISFDPTGSLEWILGGENSDFTVRDGSRWLDHAHLSMAWSDGLIAFDNRNHDRPSRVVELGWDVESREVWERWSYDLGGLVPYLGDAIRLPRGNVLIVRSPSGLLTEVDRSGEVVWEARIEASNLGRVDFVERWPPG